MISKLRLLLAVILGFNVMAAFAHGDVELRAGTQCEIRIFGPISGDDAAALLPFLQKNKCKDLAIELKNSPGGETSAYELLESYLLGEPKAAVSKIAVQGYCMSTCALIFAALPRTKMTPRSANCAAELGFHKIYYTQDGWEGAEAVINQDLVNRMKSYGVPSKIIDANVLTEGEDMYYFNTNDLQKIYKQNFKCDDKNLRFNLKHYKDALRGFDFDTREVFEAIQAMAWNMVLIDPKCSPRDWLSLEPLDKAHLKNHIKNGTITLEFKSTYNKNQLENQSICFQHKFRTALLESKQFDYWTTYSSVTRIFNKAWLTPLYVVKTNGVKELEIKILSTDGQKERFSYTFKI